MCVLLYTDNGPLPPIITLHREPETQPKHCVEIRNNFFSSQVGGFFRTNMRMISLATESFCILFLISNVNRYSM